MMLCHDSDVYSMHPFTEICKDMRFATHDHFFTRSVKKDMKVLAGSALIDEVEFNSDR
jgi:hypothetical protein